MLESYSTGQNRHGHNVRPRVDLRSDTVTQPDARMREAMVQAPLGDDVYGEDPTVIRLQDKAAELLGKEAGLFLSSGTQSNLTALLSHCNRGEEYITGRPYHTFSAEAGGAAVLGGIAPHPLDVGADGGLDADEVKAAIKPDDYHYPITRLISLENTVSGQVIPLGDLHKIIDIARAAGLNIHLDGARLMNAAVALQVPPAEITSGFDSVSLCLSKGLGAPVGSVLCGSRQFIAKARRNRKILGGGMRQSGVLAACGLVALDHNIDRLAIDHTNARRLADALSDIPDIEIEGPVETNMVFISPRPGTNEGLRRHLEEQGIVIGDSEPTIRLVTHLDIAQDDVDLVAGCVRDFYLGN